MDECKPLPHGQPEDWTFRFDKRDVGSDGTVKGKWVHKDTGEAADGERDVSPADRKNPCRRKHACLAGAGGACQIYFFNLPSQAEQVDVHAS